LIHGLVLGYPLYSLAVEATKMVLAEKTHESGQVDPLLLLELVERVEIMREELSQAMMFFLRTDSVLGECLLDAVDDPTERRIVEWVGMPEPQLLTEERVAIEFRRPAVNVSYEDREIDDCMYGALKPNLPADGSLKQTVTASRLLERTGRERRYQRLYRSWDRVGRSCHIPRRSR
jgi:hypothetical protein